MSIGGATLARGNGSGQVTSLVANDLDPYCIREQLSTYDAKFALRGRKLIFRAGVPEVASTCGLVRL